MKNDDVILLCDHSLFPHEKRNPVLWVLFFPLGILVALYRILLLVVYSVLIQSCSVQTKKKCYRVLLRVMGIRVRTNMDYAAIKTHTNGCIVAGSHVSIFDHFPALGMPLSTLMIDHVDSIAGKIMGFLLFKGSGSSYWQVGNIKDMVRKFRDWKKSPDGTALYVTPEATINNGQGLFRFRPDFLTRGRPVVPLAASIRMAFGLSPNPIDSSGISKFFRLMMCPVIHFQFDYLPQIPAYISESESGTQQEYADRVQRSIAEHLAVPATLVTREEKHAYRKGRKK